jgi:hypothetical protein
VIEFPYAQIEAVDIGGPACTQQHLTRLASMLDSGLLTRAEFDILKADLLRRPWPGGRARAKIIATTGRAKARRTSSRSWCRSPRGPRGARPGCRPEGGWRPSRPP